MNKRGPYDTKSKRISPKKVTALIEAGASQKAIADIFEISLTTLKRRFHDTLSNAKYLGTTNRSDNLSTTLNRFKQDGILV